ncbi:DUF805 domain-containing protein [Poseidonibacter lekithochrous]|uniref:DUF805 domain-containing protein n=1 Tax=Poseidonibacter TaxID=2321187 RepID=UPI001C0934B2|nr:MULTISPECIES: DUF805 domain-containing protein [Poseidonibacter]MBU3016043.1 DUF805 domain-containing protein [Poseidonibacter lekithochrous]MDO6829342.1 DUF805 domain-containing protein [Poseidonibacter sp. 1_MG-2023]
MNWYFEVLKKYTVFNGRARRSEFWYFMLFSTIVSVICAILDYIIGSDIGMIGLVYSLAVLLPTLAVGARRLHDINKSGWWQLLILIPIIGLIILIVWYAKNSMNETNKYGDNPKATFA